MDHKNYFALLIITALLGTSCSESRYSAPLSPEEALNSFQLQDGFEVEVFASEPNVLEPISMVFDERGNVYVVEMPNYGYKPEAGKSQGRIRMLRDNDGDGQIDQSVIFADSLSEATSIFPWKGGLIVAAAPNILYLKDTNADFKSDMKEVLFSGFFENNTDAQITSLHFGIDNWVYANNYGQPGEIIFSRKPSAQPLSVIGTDFRFRLDRDQFEPATGVGQFGQDFDDWGHRFITHNSRHISHTVIPWRYANRHHYLPSKSQVVDISNHGPLMYQLTPSPFWRQERTNRRNKMYQEQNLERIEYAQGHFTGASGGTEPLPFLGPV